MEQGQLKGKAKTYSPWHPLGQPVVYIRKEQGKIRVFLG